MRQGWKFNLVAAFTLIVWLTVTAAWWWSYRSLMLLPRALDAEWTVTSYQGRIAVRHSETPVPGAANYVFVPTTAIAVHQHASATRFNHFGVAVVEGTSYTGNSTYRSTAVYVNYLLLWSISTIALASVSLVGNCRLRRRSIPGTCPQCGYDMRATPNRCPECGAVRNYIYW